jgi:hypothetical protein
MQFNVAERVGGLIDEVRHIEHESEGVYLALGRLFPALVSEMDKSSENASASLAAFSSRKESASESGFRSMDVFAKESSSFFKSIHERDTAFLAHINESIKRLATLEDVIGRVRSDSEEMEIISLNAMTVALKSGNAGKAFSVITDELKRLSSRTIGLTETITDRGRTLLECFSGLRDSLRELDEFQEGFFLGLDQTLSSGYEGLQRDIKAALELYGHLLEEARGVREPVQTIMQSVQVQDIIRQSLQHVNISLEEAQKAATEAEAALAAGKVSGSDGANVPDREEELAFIEAIAELAAALLEDVSSQLEECVTVFSRESATVSGIVEGVEERRRGFVRDFSQSATDTGAEAARFSEGSARYLDLKKRVIQTARRLSEQVKGLDESFRGLAGLLARFQNIVVASRIEVAKNRALSGVTNTVQGMIELTDRIGNDVGEAMDTTKDFIKVSYMAIVDYAGEADSFNRLSSPSIEDLRDSAASDGRDVSVSESDKLLSTLKKVGSDIQILDSGRSEVGASVGGFVLYTPEFIALINESNGRMVELRGLVDRLKAVQANVSTLREDIVSEIGEKPSITSIKSERLRTMIDRFTIFTHKKTAGAIGSFDVEDGIEAGEVTLF